MYHGVRFAAVGRRVVNPPEHEGYGLVRTPAVLNGTAKGSSAVNAHPSIACSCQEKAPRADAST